MVLPLSFLPCQAPSTLTFRVDEQLKQEQEKTIGKPAHQVNRTNAIAMLKEAATMIFIHKLIINSIIKATKELVRRKRKFERKRLKKTSFNELQTIVA